MVTQRPMPCGKLAFFLPRHLDLNDMTRLEGPVSDGATQASHPYLASFLFAYVFCEGVLFFHFRM
jgi:hypothetical protein